MTASPKPCRASHEGVLAEALALAARGISVFPCNLENKAPLVASWRKEASTDPKQIQQWWHRSPLAMIGVPMGEASRLWAVDPDVPEEEGEPDGVAAWEGLLEKHGSIATRIHMTPSGGRHVLFRWSHEHPLGNRTGALPEGIHVRGEGGYVIWPPSVRRDGCAYAVVEDVGLDAVPEAPEWLLGLIEARRDAPERLDDIPEPRRPLTVVEDSNPSAMDRVWAAAALTEEIRAVAQAPVGARNNTLNRAAFNLGQIVASGLLTEDQVVRELLAAAERCGLILEENGGLKVRATIESGLKAGKESPRDMREVEARRRGRHRSQSRGRTKEGAVEAERSSDADSSSSAGNGQAGGQGSDRRKGGDARRQPSRAHVLAGI
jgi:hypothetical protein